MSTHNVDIQNFRIVKNKKVLDIISTYMSPQLSFAARKAILDDFIPDTSILPTVLIWRYECKC